MLPLLRPKAAGVVAAGAAVAAGADVAAGAAGAAVGVAAGEPQADSSSMVAITIMFTNFLSISILRMGNRLVVFMIIASWVGRGCILGLASFGIFRRLGM